MIHKPATPWGGLVVTCEHGGKRIPPAYRDYFRGREALLDSHRGYDPGALVMARALAAAFAAPLVASTVSRLLVDLNRSVGHPRLHLDTIRQAPPALRRRVLADYYLPYRARAEALVRQAIAASGRVLHLSSHSFTPQLDGHLRLADIGLLYDPVRPGEAAFCERWRAALQSRLPDLKIRRNYPYAGKNDGLTSWLRQCLPPEDYVGVELEINQKHVFRGGAPWRALRQAILEACAEALASDPPEPAP